MIPSDADVPSFHLSYDCACPIWMANRLQYNRCRKCPACLRARARQWAARCHRERESAPRCWFVTLTFRVIPENPSHEVTKWIMRVRKGLGSTEPLRYVFVTERGSLRGRLHYHGLTFSRSVVTRRDLESKWSGGFSKAKLAAPAHMSYVSKYITKDPVMRIRASSHFGSPWFDWDTAHIPLSGGKPSPKVKVPF